MNHLGKLSCVVLTKNEEQNITKCLENVSWADEVIIIDDFSQDKTVDIAKKTGAVVFSRKLNNDFSSQRNFGLSKAKYDWVLFVDADERVSKALASEIKNKISKLKNNYNGYFIKRRDFMWGRELKYGETGGISLLRLAKRVAGEWQGKVHERWNIKGEIGKLDNSLFHYPHNSINEFLSEINFYTDIRAKELFDKGIKSNFLSIILYTKLKFIQNYFIKLGFLDGTSGLILALIMSFHSFLVRGKLWLLWQKK